MLFQRVTGSMLLGAALVTGADGSWAGEAPVRNPWNGLYAGALGAFSRSVIKGTAVTSDGTVSGNSAREYAQINDRAGGLGAFVGWRQGFKPGFVAGLEADVTVLNHGASNFNRLSTGQTVATLRYETNTLATGRALAGWSFGDWVVYGTGGVAVAHERETRTQARLISGTSVVQFSETASVGRVGLGVGAGAEWRILGGWSLRADYLHARFPKATFLFPDARGGAQGAFTVVQGRIARNGAHMNLVRIGIVYNFGAGD